jgi:hypothetical protein
MLDMKRQSRVEGNCLLSLNHVPRYPINSEMTSLDSPFQSSPIFAHTQSEIIEQFWGSNALPKQLHNGEAGLGLNLDLYFNYYTYQCGLALHDGGRHVSARTHQHIIDIVQLFKKPLTRDALTQLLPMPSSPNEGEKRHGSVDLAARLLLMIDIGSLQYGFSGRKQLVWDRSSLKDFVHDHFSVPPTLGHGHVKLEKMFNARNLGQIAGVEILWTNNLTDHLRMIDEDKKLYIFHHASFLEYQQK